MFTEATEGENDFLKMRALANRFKINVLYTSIIIF